jgi:hypothetical protein
MASIFDLLTSTSSVPGLGHAMLNGLHPSTIFFSPLLLAIPSPYQPSYQPPFRSSWIGILERLAAIDKEAEVRHADIRSFPLSELGR